MIKVNVFEVKAKFSEYLDRALHGEQIVICRHNKPVAELRAIEEVRTQPRPIGALPGRPTFQVPPSFFEPLPAEELDLWEGTASAGQWAASAPVARRRAPTVAERKGRYGVRRGARAGRRKP